MTIPAKAVIFDLDGTLLDSLADIADSANSVLAANGLPTHPYDAYRFFVGEGVENMLQQAVPEGTPKDVFLGLLRQMKERYGNNWATKTHPYEGIQSLLATLAGRGIPLAVLSNKPHEITVATVKHFCPNCPFSAVIGSPAGGKAKPDPTLALQIAAEFSLPPESIAFMGDSKTDMQTATAAGMIPVGVLWGFRPESELLAHGARVVLRAPGELLEHLQF